MKIESQSMSLRHIAVSITAALFVACIAGSDDHLFSPLPDERISTTEQAVSQAHSFLAGYSQAPFGGKITSAHAHMRIPTSAPSGSDSFFPSDAGVYGWWLGIQAHTNAPVFQANAAFGPCSLFGLGTANFHCWAAWAEFFDPNGVDVKSGFIPVSPGDDLDFNVWVDREVPPTDQWHARVTDRRTAKLAQLDRALNDSVLPAGSILIASQEFWANSVCQDFPIAAMFDGVGTDGIDYGIDAYYEAYPTELNTYHPWSWGDTPVATSVIDNSGLTGCNFATSLSGHDQFFNR